MIRRHFLKTLGAGLLTLQLPGLAYAMTASKPARMLILVELKGGNDGLNTVIPYADPDYYRLRPTLAQTRDSVLQLNEQHGLHPALAPLMPLWQTGQLAVVQGVGYPEPNLSHFRSIDIWDTASKSTQYLSDGWLSRLMRDSPIAPDLTCDGLILGSQTLGPLAGGARAVVLRGNEDFVRLARLVQDNDVAPASSTALAHILKVENDIRHAARELGMATGTAMDPGRIPDAPGLFGKSVQSLLGTLERGTHVATARLTLSGFDTHTGQAPVQARLLQELSSGLAALAQGLQQQGRWQETVIMTYAEFGRRPKENGNRGTDHGTVNSHLLLGGRVNGGLYGQPPQLAGVEDGNLPHAVDFRQLYATLIEQWWQRPSHSVLGGHFATLPLLRA